MKINDQLWLDPPKARAKQPLLSWRKGSWIGSDVEPIGPVLLSANSFWNIVNFRSQLVAALVGTGNKVIIAAPDADPEWASVRGAESIPVSVDRSGLNPITDAMLWLEYVRLFRRRRPALFLCFTSKPNIYGSLAARISGATSLPNVSGLGTAFMRNGPLSRFVGFMYGLAFRGCPIVFFQNADDRDLFVQRKIVTANQARLLPGSGIDLNQFAPRPMPPDSKELRFLFIGRLLGDKGVREFVEAARRLRAEQPHWRFQLLGEVDPRNRSSISAEEIRRWVGESLVEHLGHAEDVRPYIAAAHVVVLPSYREGMPRSLLEAAAMARPLVASNVPGNRQLVEHGVNGLLCESHDAAALADAMRQIGLMDYQSRAKMGQAGRGLVERDYGVERVVSAYLEALAQLAGPARVGIQ